MDIRNESFARSLIDEIESEQFRTRREAEYKAYKISDGGQLPYIEERLKKLFPKSHTTMRISDISLSNKVLTKVSSAYKESPIRDLGKETEKLEELFVDGDFDLKMSEFDRDFNRQRYALLWVNRIDNKPSFHSLKGFEEFVKINKKTGKPEIVILNYPDSQITHTGFSKADGIEQQLSESQDDTSAESRIYAMWTAEFHSVWRLTEEKDVSGHVTKKIEKMLVPGNESESNDLGRLPFVYRSKSSSPDLPFLNQLTEQSIMYNILNSDRLTAMALQGYGQLVVSLPEDTTLQKMHTGMTTAMSLPIIAGADVQADAKYINPNPDLSGMKETVNDFAADVVSEHLGVSQSTSNGEKFSSGLERLIANASVTDKITGNQMIYSKVEKEVVDILRAYGDLAQNGQELVTTFTKSKIMISDGETLKNIKARRDMGLMTRVSALMVINPNLSKDGAKRELAEIDQEPRDKMNDFFGENKDANNTGRDKLQPRPDEEIKK